jgi:hypothetical protein
MTTAAPSLETRHSSAFVQLWAMLRVIFSLLLRPGGSAEAEARMAELELETAWSVLATALASDPQAEGLTVDDFEIVRLYNAAGVFNPDFQLKPHVLAGRKQAGRTFLLQLRHVRLARLYIGRAATFCGLRGRVRRRPGQRHPPSPCFPAPAPALRSAPASAISSRPSCETIQNA